MRSLKTDILYILIVTFLALAFAAAAFGAPPADPPHSLTVDLSGLDLHTDQGIRDAYRRIAVAATQVCHVGGYDSMRIERQCRVDTIAATVKQIGNSRLIAYWHLKAAK